MNIELISKLVNEAIIRSPCKNGMITVAELKSDEKKRLISWDINTALVSPNLISKIRPSSINVPTKFSTHSSAFAFWLYLSPASGLKRVESLVASWNSGNHTTFCPSQNFLAEFGLSPRMTSNVIYWDDLSRPKHNIVENKSLSIYTSSSHSEAFVKMDEEYLRSYLFLKQKRAVQVFQEIRELDLTEEISSLLGSKDYFIYEAKNYEVRISRYIHKQAIVRLEINGFRTLFQDGKTNSDDEKVNRGHFWKGIDGLVTVDRARHFLGFKCVYVSDDVLLKYEQDEHYDVYPESGSVHYGIHWSVSHCERVGKNAIKIELKKLYGGTPTEVIDYWNKFSIDPAFIEKNEENIVDKALRLVRKYFVFTRLLSDSLSNIIDNGLSVNQIITLDQQTIEDQGTSQHVHVKPITRVVSSNSFSKEQFLLRCKDLYIFLGESLKQEKLKKIAIELGFSLETVDKLGSIKLLDLILKYLFIAHSLKLDAIKDREEIVAEFDQFQKLKMVSSFTALNSLRQLIAHRNGKDADKTFNDSLETMGIERNSIGNDYSHACEKMYDALIDMFSEINIFLIDQYSGLAIKNQ